MWDGILGSVQFIRRVRWLPVLVFVLNGVAVVWAILQPERVGTCFVLAIAALGFSILEGVQLGLESRRTRPSYSTADSVGRGR